MSLDAPAASNLQTPAMASAVHALMQFWRVVRFRQTLVGGVVAASLLLGGLYHYTATRIYQSKASLLVLQTGADVQNTSMTAEGVRQGLMPTYERLFASNVVLEGALKFLTPEEMSQLGKGTTEQHVNGIRANLSATTARQTNIIEVAFKAKSPQVTVAVVNAVLRSYLQFMDKTHKGTAGEIISVLTTEKTQLEQRLAVKEQEVLAARRRFKDLGIRAGQNVVHPMVQRAIGLNEALIKSQQKRLELQASMAAIQAALRNGEDLQQHVMALEGAVGREFLLSGLGFSQRDMATQATLEKTLLEDQAQLKAIADYFGPKHPRVIEVQERIQMSMNYLSTYQARVDEKLQQVRQKQLGPLLTQIVQQRLAETWQHENSIRTAFEQARTEAVNLNGDLAKLEILEHDLKWLRDLRDVLLNQIAGIDLKQNHGDIRTAVVSEPSLPKAPIWPRLSIVGLTCLAGGLAVGLGLVYVLDILDDRFRSPEELRQQLGAPVLAMVRQMEDLHAVGADGILVHVQPDAVEAEAFRTLRTTLAFGGGETSRLVISSSEPGDGKTTVLANLAASFAQSGKRTLLIDADMRRPGLTTLMGMKHQGGLSDVLVSAADIAAAATEHIRATGIEQLQILPAGLRRPNPAELLASPRMGELLAWAEANYDQVLIDCPPTLAASDASIVGRLVDGLVLVVQPKKNQRRLVMRAAESITSVGVNLLGIVVNKVTAEKNDTLYGAGYGYGYGYGYGAGYGAEEPDAPPTARPLAAAGESDTDGGDDNFHAPSGDSLNLDSTDNAPSQGVTPRRVA